MPRTYTLNITLLGTEPAIWRTVVVPASITLEYLHRVIQVAMGWTNSHLHQFVSVRGDWCYSDPDFNLDHADDEFQVTLEEVAPKKGSRFTYNYDFGDNWDHLIKVESTAPATASQAPMCVGGARACPPEDVGGTYGLRVFLEAIADPDHEQHEDMMDWVPEDFDPAVFDMAQVNRELADPEAMSW